MGEYEFIRGYKGEWNRYDEINRENKIQIYIYTYVYISKIDMFQK